MSSVDEVISRALAVLAQRPSALITDIDGTLSPIVANPQDASVSVEIKDSLRRLLACLDLVGVVTGRETDVARRMVGVEGLTYVGSYALDSPATPVAVYGDGIDAARNALAPFLPRLPCVTMEIKDVSFALHYRNCDDPPGVRARLISIAEPIALQHGVRLLEGKQVLEIVPASLPDKGAAFAGLLESQRLLGSVFIGDDLSDVAIFREVRRRNRRGIAGLAVAVTDLETPLAVLGAADVTLEGVASVEALLAALADSLGA